MTVNGMRSFEKHFPTGQRSEAWRTKCSVPRKVRTGDVAGSAAQHSIVFHFPGAKNQTSKSWDSSMLQWCMDVFEYEIWVGAEWTIWWKSSTATLERVCINQCSCSKVSHVIAWLHTVATWSNNTSLTALNVVVLSLSWFCLTVRQCRSEFSGVKSTGVCCFGRRGSCVGITQHQLRCHLDDKDPAVKLLCIASWFGSRFPTATAIKRVDFSFIVVKKNMDVWGIEQWLVAES